MPTITLVRHGESESNVSGDLSIYDPGLTERGTQQASNIQGCFDLVVVSPLKRARQTLQYSKVSKPVTNSLQPMSADGGIVLALSVCMSVCVSVSLSRHNGHTDFNFGMGPNGRISRSSL